MFNIPMMSLVRTDLFEVLKIPIIGKFGIIFNNKLRKTVKDRQGIRRFFLN
jgi:hypothetical protein